MKANEKPTGCWIFHSSTSPVTLAMKPDTETNKQHSTKRRCLGKFWGLEATGIWLWEGTETMKLWVWVFFCCYTDGHSLQAQGSDTGPNSHPLLQRRVLQTFPIKPKQLCGVHSQEMLISTAAFLVGATRSSLATFSELLSYPMNCRAGKTPEGAHGSVHCHRALLFRHSS